MRRIFWDTNLFIYLFEDYGPMSKLVADLRGSMLLRGDQLLTSSLTVGEILVKPRSKGDEVLCQRYEQAISQTSVVIPFDLNAARCYASIRADKSLKAPDAVQLACASSTGVDLFVTNDRRLQSKQVERVQFIVPIENIPF